MPKIVKATAINGVKLIERSECYQLVGVEGCIEVTELEKQIVLALRDVNRVLSIKLLRQNHDLWLKDAKDLNDAIIDIAAQQQARGF